MSEQTASQWRLKVAGGDQVNVRPGESLEIGRKPLRPLPDEGVARLEIDDATKSMSKRHARFSVAADGSAVLRDLNSTNGSYVVTEKAELMRLPAGRDVPLPSSPMRIQFGDVPVDFVRIEPDTTPEPKVPNLFDYSASTTVRQEPDAADMSVDEILDLRAGEPTAVFNAQHARHAAAGSPLERIADIEPLTYAQVTSAVDAHDEDDKPPIVFSEADSRTDLPVTPAASVSPVAAPGATVDTASATTAAVAPSAQEPPADSVPLHVVKAIDPGLPRNLFVDAMNKPAETPAAAPASTDGAASADTTTPIVVGTTHAATAVAPVAAARGTIPRVALPAAKPKVELPAATPAGDVTPAAQPSDEAVSDAATVTFTPMDDASGAADPTAVAADGFEDDATGVYTPAFEPGSVFDKVSKGEFDKPQAPMVEVDGLTSEDARHTTDMTLQFEMARHPELLPFLAMNPALYDDLYAWLAAQGDADIDEALAHNVGYQDYREATGK
ncbi:FHA domain-containing protein [Bifidobacterium stellenboschense]|uniref:FHA-domain containing protein n=1 Tax=Bifidobacterium stellenboschense TaxID=762211 RepID=A0A087DSV2_9BIFI|nr:FHA domain-containing protein [Bifidobacterium stellenboschense]KFI98602.1 FHA-domain containing protein [Bifidobacterium stellenboschense]